MNYNNGAGSTYRQPYGSGRSRRRAHGAGLTYRKPYGAGAMDAPLAALTDGASLPTIGLAVGGAALGLLTQFYIIKWAVKAAGKR